MRGRKAWWSMYVVRSFGGDNYDVKQHVGAERTLQFGFGDCGCTLLTNLIKANCGMAIGFAADGDVLFGDLVAHAQFASLQCVRKCHCHQRRCAFQVRRAACLSAQRLYLLAAMFGAVMVILAIAAFMVWILSMERWSDY